MSSPALCLGARSFLSRELTLMTPSHLNCCMRRSCDVALRDVLDGVKLTDLDSSPTQKSAVIFAAVVRSPSSGTGGI